MNRFTFLKHIQPLDAHDYNYENGKKKERKKYSVYNFLEQI